ncbi:hypothetical protein [Hymenobacter sp. B81]|uniref:hypothetical protein n=1 Tax=Hymenobacter sp. B81 TaxID=3344878 RepID=UPI0037DC553A
MAGSVPITQQLHSFIARDKFAPADWEARGLHPSDDSLCRELNAKFNACAQDLLGVPVGGQQFKRVLQIHLTGFSRATLDTEEREFVCDYFSYLADLGGVNISAMLNSFLYGSLMGGLLKVAAIFRKKEQVLESISEPCTNCQMPLRTDVVSRSEEGPDTSWLIVRCNSCNGFSLLTLGPNIQQVRFGNYALIESLSSEDYTLEKAQTRLQQIRYFRK